VFGVGGGGGFLLPPSFGLSKKSRLCYILKEYNPSMHNFNVAVVDCSCMFRLLQSNHHQTVYQKCKKGIIVHVVSG